MQTMALLTILSTVATVVIYNRVLVGEIKDLKNQVEILGNMSVSKYADVKLESIEITERQVLELNKELGNAVEEIKEDIKQLENKELNNREIIMDKAEEIKKHITKEKKDLHFKFVNTPVKAVIMNGTTKKTNV